MNRLLLVGLVPLLALSCSSIPQVKVTPGDQCFRCRRTIVDTQVAGEIINGNLVTKYRGPGCLAKYLAAHADESGALLITDYTSRRMISPDKAAFVKVVVDSNTGETDYRAYKVKAEADLAAREMHTTPVDWPTVLEQSR